jgi:uncharacterized protein (DUF1330 family)
MKTRYIVALSMLSGAAIGAISVGGLNAQGKAPGAYVVFAYTDIPDPAGFKEHVGDKAAQVIGSGGGHLLARAASPNEFIMLHPGDTPFQLKRWALIGFDDVAQAKDFWAKQAGQEGRTYIEQHTKGRAFVVEALKQ